MLVVTELVQRAFFYLFASLPLSTVMLGVVVMVCILGFTSAMAFIVDVTYFAVRIVENARLMLALDEARSTDLPM